MSTENFHRMCSEKSPTKIFIESVTRKGQQKSPLAPVAPFRPCALLGLSTSLDDFLNTPLVTPNSDMPRKAISPPHTSYDIDRSRRSITRIFLVEVPRNTLFEILSMPRAGVLCAQHPRRRKKDVPLQCLSFSHPARANCTAHTENVQKHASV